MGKCEYGPKKSFYNETKCEHFQGWYGGLIWQCLHMQWTSSKNMWV
jgi:hypothetical protein